MYFEEFSKKEVERWLKMTCNDDFLFELRKTIDSDSQFGSRGRNRNYLLLVVIITKVDMINPEVRLALQFIGL